MIGDYPSQLSSEMRPFSAPICTADTRIVGTSPHHQIAETHPIPYQVVTYVDQSKGEASQREQVAVDQGAGAWSALCIAVRKLLDIDMLVILPRHDDPDATEPGLYWCEWNPGPTSAPSDADAAFLNNQTGEITLRLDGARRHWRTLRFLHEERGHGRH